MSRPSAVSTATTQERWTAGCRRDLELDPAESGIGDYDGLHEQAGTQDCSRRAWANENHDPKARLADHGGGCSAPAAASIAPLANPDAELIELGRRFVELARYRDALNVESGRLYDIACPSNPPGTVYEASFRGPEAEEGYTANGRCHR